MIAGPAPGSVARPLESASGGRCELGNPAPIGPVLPYGSGTDTGPYQCVSQSAGVTCSVNGGGFLISRAGIQVLTIG